MFHFFQNIFFQKLKFFVFSRIFFNQLYTFQQRKEKGVAGIYNSLNNMQTNTPSV